MKLEAWKQKHGRKYYICDQCCRAMNGNQQDDNISRQIHMDLNDYIKHLSSQFNGIMEELPYPSEYAQNTIYFITEEDAKKAIEWIESQVLLLTLGHTTFIYKN